MKIIVNHLTRMKPGYFCVAGVDLKTRQHVRPVMAHRLRTPLLARYGGIFDMGAVILLRKTWYVGRPPEIEDHRFDAQRAHRIRDMAPDEFWGLLCEVSDSSLSNIFGDELKQGNLVCTVEKGRGLASLGSLYLPTAPQLWLDAYNRIRVYIDDGTYRAQVGLTDLRFYEPDHQTPRLDVLEHVKQKIASGVPVILSVGLTRPWQKSRNALAKHWLQANNIHLQDDPTWQDWPLL
ncbi:MAG: dual OB domain-containing protein [Ardenticatenaceae bacterium]